MSTESNAVAFTGLVDLAAELLGGKALYANDEFFAGKENLLKPGRGVFIPDKYTEFGKWMDGWESRRKRVPGYDFCIVKLGVRGIIRGVDVDTNHFLGNHPPQASLDFVSLAGDPSVDELTTGQGEWRPLVRRSPLKPGSQNLFIVEEPRLATHVRLNIFPDGGVARLRLWGDVSPDLSSLKAGETVDLAAIQNGGRAVATSDMFFGSMDNLIMPGRAANMGDGWETKRKRVPGYDWVVLRLGVPGSVESIEVDTNHFKGNFPDTCSIEGATIASTDLTPVWDDQTWKPLLPRTKLQADHRHHFEAELQDRGPFTHVRLNIYPDGGVSRLRVFGRPGKA